jgi:hypothetical protein
VGKEAIRICRIDEQLTLTISVTNLIIFPFSLPSVANVILTLVGGQFITLPFDSITFDLSRNGPPLKVPVTNVVNLTVTSPSLPTPSSLP